MKVTMKYFKNIWILVIYNFVDKIVLQGRTTHVKFAHLNQTRWCLYNAIVLLCPDLFITDKIIIMGLKSRGVLSGWELS